jgi:hypothetical protein
VECTAVLLGPLFSRSLPVSLLLSVVLFLVLVSHLFLLVFSRACVSHLLLLVLGIFSPFALCVSIVVFVVSVCVCVCVCVCVSVKAGNGLALDYTTQVLYSPTEGDFLPGHGVILYYSLANNTGGVYKHSLNAADGAQIDQQRRLLYVSEVLAGKVLVYALESGELVRHFKAPGVTWLDDFALSPDGTQVYGADFRRGRVVRFASDGSGSGEVLASGLGQTTSVRFAGGPDFNHTSVFASEGGGLSPLLRNRAVVEIRGVL